MRRHVAFYVHHHGRGHVSRTRALLDQLVLPATVLTSATVEDATFGDVEVVRLPLDTGVPESSIELPPPAHLHYAPVGVPGLRERTALIARALADLAPALLVVDVSAEVAQLGRLAGVPTVVVRQHGARWDAAHLAAYDGAVGLLAPFGPELEEPDVPPLVRARTFYAGGFGRPPARDVDREAVRRDLGWDRDDQGVVVLLGVGGDGPRPEDIAAAARATPDHRWLVVGRWDHDDLGVAATGWVDDPSRYLAAADVVVGSAGHNTVMEVATVARPLVCVPEDRPFDEQRRKAARLRELDVAEVAPSWPSPAAWPDVLARASARGGDELGRLVAPDSARRAADWLTSLVDRVAA